MRRGQQRNSTRVKTVDPGHGLAWRDPCLLLGCHTTAGIQQEQEEGCSEGSSITGLQLLPNQIFNCCASVSPSVSWVCWTPQAKVPSRRQESNKAFPASTAAPPACTPTASSEKYTCCPAPPTPSQVGRCCWPVPKYTGYQITPVPKGGADTPLSLRPVSLARPTHSLCDGKEVPLPFMKSH